MTPLLIGMAVVAALILAAFPAMLTLANLPVFQPPSASRRSQAVSILVPARNEAAAIDRLARSVLGSRDVDLELVILDDESTDGTGLMVARLADEDSRVRLVRGAPLPSGWCGKQYACATLADHARHDIWVFLDVDVSLEPDGLALGIAFLDASGVDLVSGFPRQQTGSFLEWLLLPLIHFVLLGFLPIARSRATNHVGMAAGCGQWFITRRDAYRRAGGHAAIRASLHDGIMLPRAYRRAGLTTDIFDASAIASCRMYTRSLDVWKGLAKNATEGIGSPSTIVPFTALLIGGQVMPFILVGCGLASSWDGWPTWAIAATSTSVVLALLPRLLAVYRFGQSLSSALAHPLGIIVFLVIQWFALIRRALGFKTAWRGRTLLPQ